MINERKVPMKRYIGTKIILAKPMTRGEYNKYRGWKTPEDENPSDEGYLVEYINSPNSNHPNHKNYISWSPKGVFDDHYKITKQMDFGDAIKAMKLGFPVAREGWNGKGMFVFKHVPARIDHSIIPKMQSVPQEVKSVIMKREEPVLHYMAQFVLVKPDGEVNSWAPSSSDTCADDWYVIDQA